jgi:peptide/nickel transport system substrate-binding protein
MMTDFSGGATWQQAKSIAETDPQIVQSTLPSEAMAICFRVDREPFTDINVRNALQMAVDLETIAKSHYGGSTVGVPVGMIPPMYTGWSTPFEEWPADLKADYSYNPERAKQLLADAGFPQGFKTNTVASTSSDLNLLQIVKSYFTDIGVDMEINTMDEFTMMDYCHAGKHDQMAVERAGHMINPWQSIIVRQTGESRNLTFNNDAVFDAMIEDAVSATDIEECKRLLREADLYCLSKFWSVNLCLVNNPIFWQDYVKGYSGERIADYYMSRLWVDK